MSTKEIVRKIITSYNENVKPHIDKGHYYIAGAELENIRDSILDKREAIMQEVHMGAGFLASLDALITKCSEDEPDLFCVGSAQRGFEVCAAQTTLPKIDS